MYSALKFSFHKLCLILIVLIFDWFLIRFPQNFQERFLIDRFQVSHFRPVVMEIEIGGQSEKSLGGQESAAVDQECMGSDARWCSFALSFPIRLPLFFCRNLSHVGGSE